jgi:GNAT superfamily N-acetyltransferase
LDSSNACLKVARVTPGKVIAMCSGQLVYSTSEGSPSVWIEDMVVDQEWRARGVGRVVLQSVLDWAKMRGATRAQLLADCDNHAALAFYQHIGWQNTRLIVRRVTL